MQQRIPAHLWGLAALSGVLQVLPFPIAGPVPAWRTAFCWIALAPLIAALLGVGNSEKPLRIRDGALLGYCAGFLWYLGNCYWIFRTMHYYGGISEPVSAGILVLFCLYLGLYHALFGSIVAALRCSPLGRTGALFLSPFAWVAVELARSRITGFPWDLLGTAQVDNLVLTRIAPVTGVYGLSFVVAAVNALWLARFTLRERRYTRVVLAAVCAVIVIVYVVALRRFSRPVHEGTQAIATLVQQNLEVGQAASTAGPPLSEQQKLEQFSQLSLFPPMSYCAGIPELSSTQCIHVVQAMPDNSPSQPAITNLIVWPEAPNDFFERDPAFRSAISGLARTARAPVIAGDIGVDPAHSAPSGYYLYNSAEFIQPDGFIAGRYDKMHLVPFGEYTPYKQLFFFAGSLLQNVGLFEPGTQRTVFLTGGHRYGTFICYESIFPDEVRRFVGLGAEVLVNISDDGWYGDTSAAWEHLNMVRMRAIENHRWVLRATNTGVTAAIDPYGRVTRSVERHQRTALRAGFDFEHDVTFYAAHGDWFAYLCSAVTAIALGLSLRRRSA
ncbi:MAG TPA: apolipoprotein N-acyltransferase [Acidobacteriaceae bacterium]|nr:apolipoprotein N-acyltransferase [Acidobacteriaceae bacterium]